MSGILEHPGRSKQAADFAAGQPYVKGFRGFRKPDGWRVGEPVAFGRVVYGRTQNRQFAARRAIGNPAMLRILPAGRLVDFGDSAVMPEWDKSADCIGDPVKPEGIHMNLCVVA